MTNIFPNFKKIDIQDKKIFDAQLSGHKSYSDFNLLSMLSWDAENTNAYTLLNDNLVIKIKDYLSDDYLYSVLGRNKIDETLLELLQLTPTLNFVPEEVVELIKDKEIFEIQEDRDSFDYILSIEKLASLKGNDIKSVRHAVNKFTTLYPNHILKELDITDTQTIKAILDLRTSWCESKSFEAPKIAEEMYITGNFLRYAPYFQTISLGLYIENKLVAYTFNEKLANQTIIGLFGTSDYQTQKSSNFMEHKTAQYFQEQGYLFLNHEQDTGIMPLRAAKEVLAPVYFLKKYTITKA